MDKPKKKWYKRWWAIILWIFLGLGFIGSFIPDEETEITTPTTQPQTIPTTSQTPSPSKTPTQPATTQEKQKETPTTPKTTTPTVTKPDYDLEMTVDEIIDTFSSLTEIQQEEKFKQLKGQIIKSSFRADKIDQATLSSKYVAMQMKDIVSCKAKAFFPSTEKSKLLNANIGDTIIFSGKLTSYKFGFASCVTFDNSKLIDIEEGEGDVVVDSTEEVREILEDLQEGLGISSGTIPTDKIDECTKLCAGDDYNIPEVKAVFYSTCYDINYYGGEEALDEMIADCGG